LLISALGHGSFSLPVGVSEAISYSTTDERLSNCKPGDVGVSSKVRLR